MSIFAKADFDSTIQGLAAMIYGDLADDFQSKQSSEQVGVSSPDVCSYFVLS